jgi:uncharacterized protein involved in exopolysaccharide biosynthesis
METQIDFKQSLGAIKKRWWLLLLFAMIAVTAVYYRFGDTAMRYKTSALVMITAPPLTQTRPDSPEPLKGDKEDLIRDIVALVGTRTVSEGVAQRLKVSVRNVRGHFWASPQRKGSSLIRIEATDEDRNQAAALANAAAYEIIAFFSRTNAIGARRSREFIERELVRVKGRLAALDQSVLVARRQFGNIEGATPAIVGSYNTATTALDDARRALREIEARLEVTRDRLRQEQSTLVSETAVLENPVYRQIQAALVTAEVARVDLAQHYTALHPKMQQIEGQIAELRQRLARDSKTLLGREVRSTNPIHARLVSDLVTLDADRVAIAARIAALRSTVDARHKALAALPASQHRLAILLRETPILESTYRELVSQHQEAAIQEHVAASFSAGIQVVETATAPATPEQSNFPRTAAAGAAVGLILGAIAAIFLEASDGRMRTPADVERALGVPVLAAVPNAHQPSVTPANAMFMVLFVFIFGASLVGAYINLPFPPVNAAGQVMRATIIHPVHGTMQRLKKWLLSVANEQAGTSARRDEQ